MRELPKNDEHQVEGVTYLVRIQAAYTKVESTDHLSIFEEIELDMTYTVVERHMTLAQSKLNTSRALYDGDHPVLEMEHKFIRSFLHFSYECERYETVHINGRMFFVLAFRQSQMQLRFNKREEGS
ncbi:hypothetical protein Anapl_01209 [Anas platyrhynchos]|uniref:Uncharacterized protein n=1 Tax=Anas platyrhynchos TaxID=8839 RepID=R0K7V5_ANAPL|nr:hypothetical protein Anapl_01209 [Anas platyrhynchos]